LRFWWSKRDKELSEEVQSHLQMAARDRRERGASAEEAHVAARREFGNIGLVTETTRDAWGWRWLRDAIDDLRFALRILGKSTGFTITAILTLALGIGANTAIFSLIDAALLRALPVRDAHRLVVLRWQAHKEPKWGNALSYGDCGRVGDAKNPGGCSFSGPFFRQVRSRTELFSSVAACARGFDLALAGDGPADIVHGAQYVSGDFFQALGIAPAAGRLLGPPDDQPSASPAVVLSYRYWRSEFGGAASVIGKTVLLNKVPVIVVGVAEPRFDSLSPGIPSDIWIPLAVMPWLERNWNNRDVDDRYWWLVMIARLQPRVTREQAEAAMNTIFVNATTSGEKPLFKPDDAPAMRLIPAEVGLVGTRQQISSPLYVMFLAVAMVLLIACANVAGLLLSRASGRQKEIAVRFALGASRGRVLRQLLTESLMLALAGGLFGVLLAWWGVQSIAAFSAANSEDSAPFSASIDGRVLLFTAAVSLLTGIAFGLAPALRGVRLDLTPMLKAGARGDWQVAHRGRRILTAGNALVVAQVALSIVVLAGAGLLARTLRNLKNINPGFDARNVLTFSLDPTLLGYKPAESARFFAELQSRLNALPGVQSATYSWSALLNGWSFRTAFHLPGKPRDEQSETDILPVGLAFFETMKIPLIDGRGLTPVDLLRAQAAETSLAAQRAAIAARPKSGEKQPPAKAEDAGPPIPVIVNRAFVYKYFSRTNPLGQRLTPTVDPDSPGPVEPEWEIVGVVADAKYDDLRRDIHATMYVPNSIGSAWFSVRTSGDPLALVPAVRALVREVDSNLPIVGARTQTAQIDRQIFQERLIAGLAGFFGFLALALACIGLYGLISYEVSQRTREIGIRSALGAARRDVMGMVLRQGMQLAVAGTVAGLALAFAFLRYTKSLLFNVGATDPLTFVTVAVLLTAVMLAASYIPARRAMAVDPVVALRHE
jgi:predicted permease